MQIFMASQIFEIWVKEGLFKYLRGAVMNCIRLGSLNRIRTVSR